MTRFFNNEEQHFIMKCVNVQVKIQSDLSYLLISYTLSVEGLYRKRRGGWNAGDVCLMQV